MRIHTSSASLAFTLAAFAALSVFSGCGKKDAAAPTSSGTTAPGAIGTKSTASSDAPIKAGGDIWQQLGAKQKTLSSYRMTMPMQGQSMKQSIKFNDGKPQRMKMEMPGKSWMLIQLDKDVQYMFRPETGSAMKISLKGKGKEMSEKGADLDKLKAEAPKVSDDKVDGMDTWKLATKKGTMWIDKEYGLPRQAQDPGGKITKLKYEDINSVPDSEFELPAGTKVVDMADMMKNMPKGAPGGMPPMPKAGQ